MTLTFAFTCVPRNFVAYRRILVEIVELWWIRSSQAEIL